MLQILDLSRGLAMSLIYVMPIVALFLGWFGKINWLKAAVFTQFLLTVLFLVLLWVLLDTDRYPNAAGMDGFALVAVPFMFLVSMLASYLCYFITHWIARRRSGA